MSHTIRLIEKAEVIALLGISERTLEKLVRSKQFPEPLRLANELSGSNPLF